MIEIRITRKNRLEPTLILQSVNDVTNCKRNQKGKQFFFAVFIKYTQLIQPGLNLGIKQIHGIRDQVLQQFWDQGSKFKALMRDQSAKNIPCYDAVIWIVGCGKEVFSCLRHTFGFSVALGVLWTAGNVCKSPVFCKFGEFR